MKFVFEAFKKLRPGIPLSCLHGGMNQSTRLGVCSYFHKEKSVLFATDVASRGLDIPSVDWVVQVPCFCHLYFRKELMFFSLLVICAT